MSRAEPEPAAFDAETESAARDHLTDLGATDGLPVIVPTAERVAAMIEGARTNPAADTVLGVVEPRMGIATVHNVAVNAVMAGCAPQHFAVVCAAVRAVCNPAFNLGVVQGTTNNASPLVIVSGGPPDIASGTGALGPGHRANATIGRALRLVLLNAGGGHPGLGDMATLGQPAKFTCVVGENVVDSPFEPMMAAPAVAVIAVEGPCQVMFVPVGDHASADADRLLELLARTMLTPGSLAAMGYRSSAALLLSPLHAKVLSDAGHTRSSLQQELFERAVVPAAEIRRLHGHVRGDKDIAQDALVHGLVSPQHLIIAVAGGPGTYSAVLRGMAGGVGDAVVIPLG